MHDQTLKQLSDALASGAISSVELTQHFLKRIERHGEALNCYITVDPDRALAHAAAADKRRRHGDATALTGIPIAHKDLFCTKGVKTSCGSKMLDNFIAPYDAHVVESLDKAGAVILGKTNMDEFAMGSSNENSFYGAVRNPWDPERVPGGSSGGSAAAVAAGLAVAATATDTGGSIRQPAALCGLLGLKPSYGRVSRHGMIAFASSLDQGGSLTRTAMDAALMLEHMAGFDARDSTSAQRETERYSTTLNAPIKGMRIGIPKECFNTELDPGIAQLLENAQTTLRENGAEIREISLPHLHLSIPVYFICAPAECSSNLSRFDGVRYGHRCANPQDLNDLYCRSRQEGFGPEVKRRILMGTYALSSGYYDAYYLKAQQIRRLIRDELTQALENLDVILTPTTPDVAFKIGAYTDDPVKMYLSDIFTTPANLAGLPAMSVPVGFKDGLPVGMQLIGNYFAEAQLLNIAHQYQQITDWHTRFSPVMTQA
ncbi:MAG: Asp-tRNA(Asn)/Glu-tRNA(Gln) amidotransferase subunit GatA [Candidatus Eutrophobiaceae bacterium]